MARLPDGACQIVGDGDLFAAAQRRDADVAQIAVDRARKIQTHDRRLAGCELVDELIAVGGREERRRIAPGVAQPQLEQRHLRGVGRRLPLGVVDALFAEGADALVTVQGPLAETGGDFGCPDLGVEQRQGIGADQRRDAVDLLRQLRRLQFDGDGLEIVIALGRIGRRARVVARRQSQQEEPGRTIASAFTGNYVQFFPGTMPYLARDR